MNLQVSMFGSQEAVRMCILSYLYYLSGSKPRMHSFETVWWNSCSRFEHCAMHSAVAAPAAYAACRSPKNICKHFDDCLQRTSDSNNKDADGIRAGVKARNGQIVLAGAEACARDLGRKQQWDKWARGCSELEFVQIAKGADKRDAQEATFTRRT
jgi:hypothetical protein